MKKLLVVLSHLALSAVFGATLAFAGRALSKEWGSLFVLVMFLLHHYYNVVPAVRRECRQEMSKMMSDYDE